MTGLLCVIAACTADGYAAWLNSRQPYAEPRDQWPPVHSGDSDTLRRAEGSMLGLACGDAMGAFFEFKSPAHVRTLEARLGDNMRRMKGSDDFLRSCGVLGAFGDLPRGAWTDDTSMALCLASSLLVAGRHDPHDQLARYSRWLDEGYLSSTGRCFGAGHCTRRAICAFKERVHGMADGEARAAAEWRCGPENGAGNGCLVRVAPVAIFFSRDIEDAIWHAGESAGTTHDTVRTRVVLDACRYFGALVACAVRGYAKERLLSSSFCSEFRGLHGLCDEVRAIAEKSYACCPTAEMWCSRRNGYVLVSLEAALWAFANDGGSFEKGVMDIIRLGYDTDTIAAIYGQLAGACYGVDGIPADWVSDLMHADFIRCIGAHLCDADANARAATTHAPPEKVHRCASLRRGCECTGSDDTTPPESTQHCEAARLCPVDDINKD